MDEWMEDWIDGLMIARMGSKQKSSDAIKRKIQAIDMNDISDPSFGLMVSRALHSHSETDYN